MEPIDTTMKKYLDASGAAYLYKKFTQDLPLAMSIDRINQIFPLKNEYLTFEALEDGTFSFSKDGLSYSLDNGATWATLSADSSTPMVTTGSKVLWKGNYFSSTGKFNTSGNIMSLMHGDDFEDKTDLTGSDYCFCKVFSGCSNLINTPGLALPATVLSSGCYAYMFHECTSLTTSPALPAKKLTSYCYDGMFQNCTSLTTAPELPATILVNHCYDCMFYGCTSLTTAPELPATTLASGCYAQMFRDCSKLNRIKALFTTDPSTSNYTTNWVLGVSRTGTFVKNAAATWNVTGISGVPSGWDVILSN